MIRLGAEGKGLAVGYYRTGAPARRCSACARTFKPTAERRILCRRCFENADDRAEAGCERLHTP